MPPQRDKWIRRFVINDTTRHKNGFTIYKVSSVIYLKSSPDAASRVSVWKRYNDFKQLHSALKIIHAKFKIKETFPHFAKPKFFGRFEADVVNERRECAVKFLEYVAKYQSLFGSDEFVKFFETSLGDDQDVDCSRSTSSDASSEDDKSAPASDLESVCNCVDEDIADEVENCRIDDYRDDASKGDHVSTSNDGAKGDHLGWLGFWSVEKLVEDGRNDDNHNNRTSILSCDATDSTNLVRDSGQYILIAAAHMSAGFRHEAIAEYEEAFMQYKLGIATLRHGVQKDLDVARRNAILDKIVGYSERADRLYDRHLNCNISMMSKPVSELQYYKVLQILGSVMLVKDVRQVGPQVVKTVEKPAGAQVELSKYILRGRVPHMVRLHACVQTETTVFLILQYASGGKLWDFMKKHYPVPGRKRSSRQKSHVRSMSCEPSIDRNSKKLSNNSSPERTNPEAQNLDSQVVTTSNKSNEYSTSDENLPTTQLLKNAHQLLESVDATIKKSNTIASRLKVSQVIEKKILNDDEKNTKIWNTSESSTSLSPEDSSSDSDRGIDVNDGKIKSNVLEQFPLGEKRELRKKNNFQKFTTNEITLINVGNDEDSFNHDDDSGIEMEQERWRVPETILKSWTAQIILCLEALHQQDVVVADLRPDNVLVTEDNEILLSYLVPRRLPELSKYQKPYTAPELSMYSAVVPATTAADVWSLGVILYEIYTGISRHPGPFHSHSIISIPNEVSDAAKSLLTKVLRYDPNERLTIPEIKQLPFFESIDWLGLLNA